MKVPPNVDSLLNRPMNRGEFLRHVGVASLFLLGAGFIVKSMNVFDQTTEPHANRSGSAYGVSSYGGRRLATPTMTRT